MKMYINGEWMDRAAKIPVLNPFDQSTIDTVPRASASDVETAIASAARGAEVMAKMTALDRYTILRRTADLMAERIEELGRTITMEEGKVIAEGRVEASRAVQTITLSAEESKRLHGETVPLDSAPGFTGQFGFTIRVPVGVVAAIAPFNFPLNLVCHKVGPALAAGNAVVLKPAGDTPLSAIKPHRNSAGSRIAPGSHPVCHRLRSRDRGRDYQRSEGAKKSPSPAAWKWATAFVATQVSRK